MLDAISNTLEQWAADDRVRVVVPTGAGTTFREGFEVEHDRAFDEFLLGAFGPGPGA